MMYVHTWSPQHASHTVRFRNPFFCFPESWNMRVPMGFLWRTCLPNDPHGMNLWWFVQRKSPKNANVAEPTHPKSSYFSLNHSTCKESQPQAFHHKRIWPKKPGPADPSEHPKQLHTIKVNGYHSLALIRLISFPKS